MIGLWLLACNLIAVNDRANNPCRARALRNLPKLRPDSTAVEAGEDAGDYTVISSIEFGYRGLSVDGDLNKYQSDLNYKAGPRLFDSSFLMKSKDGKGELFDTLLVTSTGWGADPQRSTCDSASRSRSGTDSTEPIAASSISDFSTASQIRIGYLAPRPSVVRPIRSPASTAPTRGCSWEISI